MNILRAMPLVVGVIVAATTLEVRASSTFHPADNEAGAVNHVAPGKLTKAEHAAFEREEVARIDPNWKQVGGDSERELVQHSYELRSGRIVHTDSFRHDTPRPTPEPDAPALVYPAGG